MSLQALSTHLSNLKPSASCKNSKVHASNSRLLKGPFSYQHNWSPIHLKDLSQFSEAFARQTWKCECGFNNYTDIWACASCGRPRPT